MKSRARPQDLPLLLVLVWLLAVAVGAFAQQGNDPVASPRAIVVSGEARFTVLTPQMIRMEWAENRLFEDHASLVFINRRLPVPNFRTYDEGKWLIIRTDRLLVRYRKDSGRFTAKNLLVEFNLNGQAVVWRPEMPDTGNLHGTVRTLDGVRGATALEPGLLSRDGWVVVDDSERPLLDESEWSWVMARPPGHRQDWYFFGYGHDYKQALYDFTRVGGRIPLPPRFTFGAWWSRYWAYTDQELRQLVGEFESHDVPLDVLVIDMDWHPTFGVKWWENKKDQSGHTLGWTGYTWNRQLFPDPAEFLAWAEAQGLKTPLNLHPASGVQPHEERYPEMARAMGIDPATQKYVPFDIVNKEFAENYVKILHHPLEQQGVDFWWLDWQQEPTTGLEGINPTWWLNYVHFTDMERRGKRPLLFHRWGGLGNHRYQIGFSGDTVSVWESLAFQPYFTATAANVGYGYWSHDIGGHMPGVVPPELYLRWIQFGVFSPVLRTHTTKNPDSERRIWAYPAHYAGAMRDAYLLRYALVPYIYTQARKTFETGSSLCHPIYYDYPRAPEAYESKDQYMFGEDMLVAPVTAPVDEQSQLASKSIWLPEGDWIEWFTGTRLKGPARIERSFTLAEVPVYVKAGSVIPMQPKMRHTGEKPVDPLILTIFPGHPGSTRVYEDEGNTLGYKQGAYAWTTVRHDRLADGTLKVEILPTEGAYPGMPAERSYEIRLFGSWPPQSVTYNGIPAPPTPASPGWWYDGDALTLIVSLPTTKVTERVEVLVKLPPGLDPDSPLLDGVPGKLRRLRRARDLLNTSWPQGASPDVLTEAVQTGNRMRLRPATAAEELGKLERSAEGILRQIEAMDVDRGIVDRALAHLGAPGTQR